MTIFDWILLVIAIFFLILNGIQIFYVLSHPMLLYPNFKVKIGWGFWFPWILLLVIAYRLWG